LGFLAGKNGFFWVKKYDLLKLHHSAFLKYLGNMDFFKCIGNMGLFKCLENMVFLKLHWLGFLGGKKGVLIITSLGISQMLTQ
jgi:hypothetical protein